MSKDHSGWVQTQTPCRGKGSNAASLLCYAGSRPESSAPHAYATPSPRQFAQCGCRQGSTARTRLTEQFLGFWMQHGLWPRTCLLIWSLKSMMTFSQLTSWGAHLTLAYLHQVRTAKYPSWMQNSIYCYAAYTKCYVDSSKKQLP